MNSGLGSLRESAFTEDDVELQLVPSDRTYSPFSVKQLLAASLKS
jgi:hypothetical protein